MLGHILTKMTHWKRLRTGSKVKHLAKFSLTSQPGGVTERNGKHPALRVQVSGAPDLV